MVSTSTAPPIHDAIVRLAQRAPSTHPVVSCFVNVGPDGSGRPTFPAFVKKAFTERIRSFPERSPARAYLEADRDRIVAHLTGELDPATRAVAVYASEGDGLWEAHAFRATFDDNHLVVGPVPHLYPLVKLVDQTPVYAVCVADAHGARVVVCGLGDVLAEEDFVPLEPVDRTRVARWAEPREQPWVDEAMHKNARVFVERLSRILGAREVDYLILAGDEPFASELRRELPPVLSEKLLEVERIPFGLGARQILEQTIEVVRLNEAMDGQRLADTAIDRFRAGGSAVAGLDPTIEALNQEQVDILLLHESFDGEEGWQCSNCRVLGRRPAPERCPFCESTVESLDLREAMLRRAERMGRGVEIVEEHDALRALDGVAALLRYRS